MLGIVLRTPFTTLPTVLSDIAAGLGVDVSSLGLLTSLPLLTFAIFSPFAIQFAKKLGIERLFFLVLIAITIGSAIRIINLPFLYLGTILIGAGIAFLNVLLPSLIQANRPRQLGILTTLYITSMGMSTAIASSVAVPITKATSWQGLVNILTALCALALVIWIPNLRYNHHLKKTATTESSSKWYTNKYVWAIMIFGGLQSLLFYTSMTWLPTMAVQAGLSKVESGLLASVFTLISLPFSLTIPSLTTRLSDRNRRLMLAIVVGAGILGVAMLLIPTSNFFYWLVLNALIGSSVSSLFPYLMVAFSMKSSTPEKNSSTFWTCPNRRLRLCSLWSHSLRLQQISLPLLDTSYPHATGLNHYHGDCPLSGGKSRSYFITIVRLEDSSSGFFVHTKRTRL